MNEHTPRLATAAVMRCQRCSGRMVPTRNEYYGVGLSVHEFYYLCPACSLVVFPAAAIAHKTSPATPTPTRWERLRRFLGRRTR